MRHLDTLRERLKPCMVRRVRQEVLDQLPSRTDVRVPVEMTEAQLEEHDALNQPIAQLVQRAKTRPLTQARVPPPDEPADHPADHLQRPGPAPLRGGLAGDPPVRARGERDPGPLGPQAAGAPAARSASSCWSRAARSSSSASGGGCSTLAHWAVGDLLAENGLRAGFFTGAEGQQRRTQNIVEFHDDPDHRLLFASDAGGVGLNLQHAANCVINLELPWNPAVLEQRIGRIYRLGQKQPDRRLQPRLRGGDRVADRRPRRLQAGVLQGALRRRERRGPVRALRLVPLARSRRSSKSPCRPPTSTPKELEDDPSEFADLISDDEIGDPFDELVDAADESQDQAEAQPDPILVDADQTPAARPPAPEDRQDVPGRPATSTTEEVRQLFSQLRIRREVDGRVIIEAPAEAASTLGALFEGMAAMLQSMSTPPGGDGPA